MFNSTVLIFALCFTIAVVILFSLHLVTKLIEINDKSCELRELQNRLNHLRRVHRFHFVHYKMLIGLASQNLGLLSAKSQAALDEMKKILLLVDSETEKIEQYLEQGNQQCLCLADEKLSYYLNDTNKDTSRKLATSRYSEWEMSLNQLASNAVAHLDSKQLRKANITEDFLLGPLKDESVDLVNSGH